MICVGVTPVVVGGTVVFYLGDGVMAGEEMLNEVFYDGGRGVHAAIGFPDAIVQ